MRWFRKRHQRPTPREPDPEDLRKAREAAEQAREQLMQTRARDPEVSKLSDRLERTDRANNLGPKFWAALGRPGDV